MNIKKIKSLRNKVQLNFRQITYTSLAQYIEGTISLLGLGKQLDPDQTASRGAVWSGSTLFAIPSASFGLYSRAT